MFEMDFYKNEDFSNQSFEDEKLSKVKFVECDFVNSDFSDAELSNCTFDKCRFSNAKLNSAVLYHCSFNTCEFKFASFFDTFIDNCRMMGSGFTGANITCINISGGDWSYTDLRQLEFYKMKICDVNFEGADLVGAKLEKSVICRCNLNMARTSNLSLRGSDIRETSISDVDILGINFKDTKIDLTQSIIISSALGAIYTP